MKLSSEHNWIKTFNECPETAWTQFLKQYHETISRIIARMVKTYDDRMNAYTFVLENLSSNRYKKILAYFERHRNYDFPVWISVIVRNLCSDWYRSVEGRTRHPRFVSELDQVDQLLFRYRFEKKFPVDIVYDLMTANHQYAESFCQMLERLNLIEEKWYRRKEFVQIKEKDIDPDLLTGDDPDDRSDQAAIVHESLAAFKETFESLEHRNQLILKLYFLHGMTLKEISEILKINSIWRVHRRLNKSISLMSAVLSEYNITAEDFDLSFLTHLLE